MVHEAQSVAATLLGLGLAALLFHGCTPMLGEGVFSCERGGCPSSWICADNQRCYSSLSEAERALDAGASEDAGPTLDSGEDAGVSASCFEWGEFSDPSLAGLSGDADSWVGAVTRGGDALYTSPFFSSTRNDIWRWDGLVDGLPVSAPVVELNSPGRDAANWVSQDETLIVFESDRAGGLGETDLWQSTRVNSSFAWETPELLKINSIGAEARGSLSPDGLSIFFVSNRDGIWDVYSAARTAIDAPFAGIVRRADLSSSAVETCVTVSADLLEAFLCTTRNGGVGSTDVWRATRESKTQSFGTSQWVSNLSSAREEVNLSLSRDGTKLYYNYDSVGATGDGSEVRFSERVCLR